MGTDKLVRILNKNFIMARYHLQLNVALERLNQGLARVHTLIKRGENQKALQTNLNTRKEATKHLRDGGVVIIFPAGGISLSPNLIGPALDTEWKTFASKLAQFQDTTILPFFFDGKNSILYQCARRISITLGYSLMFREICKKMDKTVSVTLRKPLHSSDLINFSNRNSLTDYLRNYTYGKI